MTATERQKHFVLIKAQRSRHGELDEGSKVWAPPLDERPAKVEQWRHQLSVWEPSTSLLLSPSLSPALILTFALLITPNSVLSDLSWTLMLLRRAEQT